MKGTRLVLKQMIMMVSTVADELEEDFIQYYDQIMSVMKRLMVDVLNEEDQVLIGRTVECVTAIGMAVGKDKVRSTGNGCNAVGGALPDMYARCPRARIR